MKKFFRDIHLYLSLAAGIVIAIVCFTGAALVFEKEWQEFIYPERYRTAVGSQKVSLDAMVATLQQTKGVKAGAVKVYTDPTRTVEIGYNEDKEKGGKDKGKGGMRGREKAGNEGPVAHEGGRKRESHAKENGGKAGKGKEGKGKDGKKGGGGRNSHVAYFNAYTGELIATSAQKSPFFKTMFELHRWLLVQEPGKLIVGVSTIFFLFIIVTGIVLWWPKNVKIMKQRLKMKWSGGWKRINHDLHIVVGFYTAIFLFVFAFTGLAWSFEWFNNAIFTVTNSAPKPPEHPHSTVPENGRPVSFDQVYATAQAQMPAVEFYNLNKPREAEDPFTITVMPTDAAHERASNQLYLDQYSGQPLGKLLYEEKNLGQRVRATFYPVHVGSIGGLTGRIIAFISCVAGFTFPITGIILWLNRLSKEKKKKKKARKTQIPTGLPV